jgi:hypothetical protein
MNTSHSKRSKKLTCFVSATIKADLTVIKDILRKKGVEYKSLYELAVPGLTIIEELTEVISKADLFLAVLDSPSPNPNIAFELGYAYALKKPILILAPPEMKVLPDDFRSLLYIRAETHNEEAIGFAIDQILAAPKSSRETSKRSRRKPAKTTKPIGMHTHELLNELDSLGQNITEADLQRIIQKALHYSGVSVVAHSQERDAAVDFAVWVDELEPIIGNPIIIEIKRRIRDSSAAVEIRNQIFHYLSNGNSRGALVLYLDGDIWDSGRYSLLLPNIFFIKIRELLSRLERASFGDVVRNFRNAIVHGRVDG